MCAKESLLLEVKDLRVQFHTKRDAQIVKAVDGLDLAVYRGRALCLLGESGCGKSAVCRALAGADRQPEETVSGRARFYPEKSLIHQFNLSKGCCRTRETSQSRIPAALIGQEPVPSLSFLNTIGSQMVQMIRQNHKTSIKEARSQAVDLLDRLGLPRPNHLIKEFPFRLPAGIHRRIVLALALSCEPSLLMIDDPAVMLDVPSRDQVMDVISAVQRETGMSVLYTARDPDVAAQLADDIAVIYQGKIVEFASVQAVFSDPKHPYTQALCGMNLKRSGLGAGDHLPMCFSHPHDGCAYYPYCVQALPECAQFAPQLVTVCERHDARCLMYETLPSVPFEPYEQREPDSDIWQLERLLMQ